MDNRAKIKESHPGIPNMAIMRMLADLWRNLPEAKKTPYKDLARQERDVYVGGQVAP
jgi:hypothetical protein